MAIEKKWAATGPYSVSSPGTMDGVLTLTLPSDGFLKLHVKQRIRLSDPVQPALDLEIKRFIAPNTIEVGSVGSGLSNRTDVSAYGTSSIVFAPEQPRNSIPLQELVRAVYEEEPGVSWRATIVDPDGRYVTTQNPLPVEVSGITIDNINVHIDARDNYPNPGDVHDSVRIGDGSHEVVVNPDGSLNVVVEPFGDVTSVVSTYSEALAVASGITTTVTTYTVPAGKTAALQRVEVNGENIADYKVLVGATVVDRKRTYFGSSLNENFQFDGFQAEGFPLIAGNVVSVTVLHNRPSTANFGARIQVLVIG